MIERIKIIISSNNLEKKINDYIDNEIKYSEAVHDIKYFKDNNEIKPTRAILHIGTRK